MFESQKNKNSLTTALRILSVAAVFCAGLYGCAGGGTSGSDTAGRSIGVAGQVVNSDGAPRSGVEVTLLETGDSSSTDDSGVYALEGETDAAAAHVEFRDDSLTAQVEVPNLPQDSVDITLDVEAQPQTQSVKTKKVAVKRRPPTPTPTPEPQEPTAAPTTPPTSTPGGVEPTISPSTRTPEATATARETPTGRPTRTPTDGPTIPPTRTPPPGATATATPTVAPSARWILDGTLRDRSGNAVSGARVEIQETGAQDSTDSSGAFSMSMDAPGTSATVQVTVGSASGRARLTGLPASRAHITISVQITNALNPPPSSLTVSARVISIE